MCKERREIKSKCLKSSHVVDGVLLVLIHNSQKFGKNLSHPFYYEEPSMLRTSKQTFQRDTTTPVTVTGMLLYVQEEAWKKEKEERKRKKADSLGKAKKRTFTELFAEWDHKVRDWIGYGLRLGVWGRAGLQVVGGKLSCHMWWNFWEWRVLEHCEVWQRVSSPGRPELLSYEPQGDQRGSRKNDIYPNNSVYLQIQLVPLSTFLAMQNIKSPVTKANEQVNQKSLLFWCLELKRADSLVSTDLFCFYGQKKLPVCAVVLMLWFCTALTAKPSTGLSAIH